MDEPRLTRGEHLFPAPRNPIYPRPAPRFPGPTRTCAHCGLDSQTTELHCPVCAAPFPSTRIRRAFARLRRTR